MKQAGKPRGFRILKRAGSGDRRQGRVPSDWPSRLAIKVRLEGPQRGALKRSRGTQGASRGALAASGVHSHSHSPPPAPTYYPPSISPSAPVLFRFLYTKPAELEPCARFQLSGFCVEKLTLHVIGLYRLQGIGSSTYRFFSKTIISSSSFTVTIGSLIRWNSGTGN